jgi:hypothetical protein
VQQKLMRHTDIRTTMNLCGDVVTDEMAQAHSKVVCLALAPRNSDNGLQSGSQGSELIENMAEREGFEPSVQVLARTTV